MRGYYYQAMGRADVTLGYLERARDLTPDWSVAKNDVLDSLVDARRFDDAVAAARKAIALDARDVTPYATLGSALSAQGRFDEAMDPLRKAVTLSPASARHKASLAWACAKSGRRDEALALIAEIEKTRHPWMPISAARVYTALGDHDQVFAWLNRAADEKFAFLWDVRNRFEFDPIRNDPRYAQLLARIKLK
jgi:tetratricopeptide (TPR) repeat protein